MTEKLYVPGDPSETRFVQQLLLISGLIERSTKMYVTAKHWGQIIAELDAQYMDSLMDPTKPAPWHGNRPMAFGIDPQLLVLNAGTDDQLTVNALNHETPGAINFQAKIVRLRTG